MLNGELVRPVVGFFHRYLGYWEHAQQFKWRTAPDVQRSLRQSRADLLVWAKPERKAAVLFERSLACAIGSGGRGVLRVRQYPAHEHWLALPRHVYLEDTRGDLEKQCRRTGVGLILVWGDSPTSVADWWVLPGAVGSRQQTASRWEKFVIRHP